MDLKLIVVYRDQLAIGCKGVEWLRETMAAKRTDMET